MLARAARAHGLDADEAHAIKLFEGALGQFDEDAEPHRVAGTLAELAAARWAILPVAKSVSDIPP